jgi:hypothetical protein
MSRRRENFTGSFARSGWRGLIFIPAVLAITLQSCDDGGGSLLPPDAAWVATEPTQCLTNPWEQEWLARHDGNYAAYPRDLEAQEAIIAAYYAGLGVEVEAIVSRPKYEVVCLACSCPRGDTLYLLVAEDDAEMMELLGYRKEDPRPIL